MAYNPNILPDVLRSRALSKKELSARLGLSRDTLDGELRKPEPRQTLLNDIAKELALPVFVFFMEKPPPLSDVLPDFRSPSPSPTAKSRQTLEAIQLAESIQRTAEELSDLGSHNLPRFGNAERASIAEFALRTRQFFEISLQDQISAKDAHAFYNVCRRKIESKGIFVIHDNFPWEDGSGFCLAHREHPVIVINTTNQTRGRRLFTLAHELAHVLMGKSGISDPFVRNNDTETLCNQFASAFLLPERYVTSILSSVAIPRTPDLGDVARIAKRLKISQQASVLRLEELGIFQAGSHNNWLRAVHNLGNPDYSEKRGGAGGPPPQEKVKLAKYGFHFASVFASLVEQGLLSDLKLYRATGLKPKYQHSYFQYAQALSTAEISVSDFDDD